MLFCELDVGFIIVTNAGHAFQIWKLEHILIRSSLIFLNGESFRNLFVSLVRLHLKYYASVWNHYLKNIKLLLKMFCLDRANGFQVPITCNMRITLKCYHSFYEVSSWTRRYDQNLQNIKWLLWCGVLVPKCRSVDHKALIKKVYRKSVPKWLGWLSFRELVSFWTQVSSNLLG